MQSSIGPMPPWQASEEKSQKIRKVEGRILYGRDGSSVPACVVIFLPTKNVLVLTLILSCFYGYLDTIEEVILWSDG